MTMTTGEDRLPNDPWLIYLALGALGLACVHAQLALMRELLAAFAGNEIVVGIILGAWLLLMGIGSRLGQWWRRLGPVRRLFPALQILVALLPLVQIVAIRALRNVVFIRGATPGIWETLASIAIVLLPFCVVAGFFLAMACDWPGADTPAAGIRRVYVADSLGSILGGLLFSFVLVHFFDHLALLGFSAFINLLLAGWSGWKLGSRGWVAAAGIATVLLALGLVYGDVDARSTARQYPAQQILFRGNSPYGRLVVTDYSGQINFYENGLPMFSAHNLEQIEETVHYAMAQRPEARRVLLVGGGISGTAKEILRYPVEEVVYVELDPLLIEIGRRYLPENLADPRITVATTDARRFLKQTGQQFDVIIVDAPDPSTSQINRLYTAEFFDECRRVLAADGVLSISLASYQNFVSPELARLLSSAHRSMGAVFEHVLALPGGRVFLLGSGAPLTLDIAQVLKARGLRTRLVNEHYLNAMLSPDRLADIDRALTVKAAVNRDLNPVLYYYHLRHWLSQFAARFGLLAVIMAVALGFYLWRLKAVPLAVFASGFAASSLEVGLLLVFQVLFGSLYQQLGLIITLFMAGLAAGAWLARFLPAARSRRWLIRMAAGLAAFSVLLPSLLHGVQKMPAGSWLTSAAIPLLTFVLALMVGLEFLLAARTHAGDSSATAMAPATATAARLYSADFAGACLGALAGSVLLIPLLGVTATCLVTAGLKLVSVAALALGKTRP